jgi:hypothetical protein
VPMPNSLPHSVVSDIDLRDEYEIKDE